MLYIDRITLRLRAEMNDRHAQAEHGERVARAVADALAALPTPDSGRVGRLDIGPVRVAGGAAAELVGEAVARAIAARLSGGTQ